MEQQRGRLNEEESQDAGDTTTTGSSWRLETIKVRVFIQARSDAEKK